MEADLCIGNEGHCNKGVPSTGNQGDPHPLGLAVLEHPYGDTQECEQGQGLVGPCEVTPQQIESIGAALRKDQNHRHQREDDGGQAQALRLRALIDVQRVRDGQAQRTQRGIAGGDGQNDDAQQGDDAAHGAQQIAADDADSAGGQRGIDLLQTQVVHAHSGGGPDHGNEAFQNHHIVEGHAALLLALHGAGDDSGLRGMEAGENAAGHSDEEHRNEVLRGEILTIIEGGALPVVPQVQQGIALDEHADEHTHGRQQQDSTEDGIDAADDGIDGEHGGDQIINEDDTVNHPGGDRGGSTVKTKHLSGGDVAGGVDEHRADQQQQYAQENLVNSENTLVGVLADHVRHLGAAVAEADHAGEIVVHSSADYVADGDGDECDGPEQDALNGSDDGAGACDIQQVDEAVLPSPHGNVVHAVLLGISGRLPVIGAEDLFAELAIDGCAYEQNHQADEKGCHRKHTLLYAQFPGQILALS